MSASPDSERRNSPLAAQLREQIARSGPMRVAAYMQACLHDPVHGYYRGQPAIGRSGDFITAPEISQVFGELIGLWCAVVWQQMGGPETVRLIELGPGRGTLIRDALRAARLVPAFRSAIRLELVESNATLETAQRATLASEAVAATWHREIASGTGPAIVIANEFLDTLPIEQQVLQDGTWRTRCIGLGADGGFAFTDGPADVPPPRAELPAPDEGAIFESRQQAFAELADKLAHLGAPLAALFIDYGHTRSGFGDTLQAVTAHRYEDPLASPGAADLTAQVDFAAFAEAARACGLACEGPVPQAAFLGRLGVIERASRLMATNPGRAAEIEAGVARLVSPAGMGSRFQVMGIRSVDLAQLPALADVDTGRSPP